jgi:hypothetical protein
MADILLSTEDLTVFGGPETVSLDLDFGPTGDRGNFIIGLQGDPRDATVASTTLANALSALNISLSPLDIVIDYLAGSPTYKTMFQYVRGSGNSFEWQPLLSLKNNFYSGTQTVVAADGKLTLSPINITYFYDLASGPITASNINVQYSIASSPDGGPVASSMVINEFITSSGVLAVPIEINGVEYIDGSWGPITGTKVVHLFISVV